MVFLLYFINFIRFFTESIFFYKSYKTENKKFNIKEILIFLFIFLVFTGTYNYFLKEHVTYRLFSVLIVFIYFWFENNNLNKWKFPLTYAIFTNLIMECSHILCFKVVSFSWDVFRLPQVPNCAIIDKKLIIFRAVVAILYSAFLFLIYKTKSVKIKILEKFSKYVAVPIFLIFNLMMVIYLKHNLKYVSSDDFHNVLSTIFLFFIPILIATILGSERFAKIIDNLQNKIELKEVLTRKLQKEIDENRPITALEDAARQTGKGPKGLHFNEEKYQLEQNYFKNKLESLGVDFTNEKKWKTAPQLTFAAVLAKELKDPGDESFNKNVYIPTAEIIKRDKKTVYRNIENVILKLWDSKESKIFKKIKRYYNGPISETTGAPTATDFLIHMVNEAKKEESEI